MHTRQAVFSAMRNHKYTQKKIAPDIGERAASTNPSM